MVHLSASQSASFAYTKEAARRLLTGSSGIQSGMPRAVHTQKKRFPGQKHWAVPALELQGRSYFFITRQNNIGRENIRSPRCLLSFKQKFKHTTSGSLLFLMLGELAVGTITAAVHGGCFRPARESEVFSAELILTLCLVMTSRLELAYFCGDALGAPSSRGWYEGPLRAAQSLLCYWIWLWWVKAPRMLVKEKEKKTDLKNFETVPKFKRRRSMMRLTVLKGKT